MNFQDLQAFDGLQFMPVTQKKLPIVKGWQTLFKKHNLDNCEAVGLVCGKLSGNLEAIDVDTKYDITGTLFTRYKRMIAEVNKDLLNKLVVQKTQSGGYHLIYRCEKIEGNLKLAQRKTTDAEKKKEFDELKKALPDLSDELLLRKVSKVKVLLETRGEGGYVMCYPSKGYEIIFRDYYGITEITVDERETLLTIARQFNEVVDEFTPKQNNNKKTSKGLSPFEDYNERGDVVALLETHGWKQVGRKAAKTVFLRPGQTTSQSSGNYDHDKKWFSVFTTSSEFEPQKAYLPHAVYAMLETNNDFGKAVTKLYDEGYGDRREQLREINASIPSRIGTIDNDYSFIAKPRDYDIYLQQARTDTLPKGLTTGLVSLDKHFLFKLGNMVISNGVDNVGKTKASLYLTFLSALLHGWNWLIFSSENSLGSLMRTLIEFYWSKKLNLMNQIEYETAKYFIEKHFSIIKTEERLFNYRDIMNMAEKCIRMQPYQGCMIDPYNSLKIELNNSSKLSTHEYHYEAISELKMHGSKHSLGYWINNHAVTAALRNRDTDGFTKAPGKEDTEGGGKFSNKADEFITYHRQTQHPNEWMWLELHIRKVKETETGGRVTPKDSPVKIKMNETGCGYRELTDLGIERDPVMEFHRGNKPEQKDIFKQILWTPYKSDDGTDITF